MTQDEHREMKARFLAWAGLTGMLPEAMPRMEDYKSVTVWYIEPHGDIKEPMTVLKFGEFDEFDGRPPQCCTGQTTEISMHLNRATARQNGYGLTEMFGVTGLAAATQATCPDEDQASRLYNIVTCLQGAL